MPRVQFTRDCRIARDAQVHDFKAGHILNSEVDGEWYLFVTADPSLPIIELAADDSGAARSRVKKD